MYVKVKLINGFQKPLLYKVPAHWKQPLRVNDLVKVPLQKRTEFALIDEINVIHDKSYIIRELLDHEIIDQSYTAFIEKIARYYAIAPSTLYKRIKNFLQSPMEKPEFAPTSLEIDQKIINFTDEQKQVIMSMITTMQVDYKACVLHGVTGSGKTEVYKALMQHILQQGKTIIFMVPEVSLAMQFTKILHPYFTNVYGFHSATSAAERKRVWQALHNNDPMVLVGVHLPILLPIKNVGLIIIDEEHDSGYQEKKHPKMNSKEIALIRAQYCSVPIVLGSATPALSTLYGVEQKKYHYFALTQRFSGNFPQVKTVVLDREKRPHFWISPILYEAIRERLHKKEQSIIFLNRRGHSFFIQCLQCSYIVRCNACSVSMTLHEDKTLRCHYCNYCIPEPTHCMACKAPEKSLLKKGIGTQQLMRLLKEQFPAASIERADVDATAHKKKWQATVEAFTRGDIDILVGTQTITKGYHFPRVTLVGMIWADVNLALPLYNAAEITVQQIIQVAGRAGRQSPESEVIIQTLREYELFKYVTENDYRAFYEYEMKYRKELRYPPYYRLAEIELRHTQENVLIQEAELIVSELYKEVSCDLIILGPTVPAVHKINHVFSRKIILKAPTMGPILAAYLQLHKKHWSAQLFLTPQPQNG